MIRFKRLPGSLDSSCCGCLANTPGLTTWWTPGRERVVGDLVVDGGPGLLGMGRKQIQPGLLSTAHVQKGGRSCTGAPKIRTPLVALSPGS